VFHIILFSVQVDTKYVNGVAQFKNDL
jgi:hypothetical protein